MDTQQNTKQSGINTSVPVSNPPQPPIMSEGDPETLLLDFGDTTQLSESQDSIYHYFVASPVFAGFGNLNSPERVIFIDNLNKISLSLKNYLTSSDTTELIFSSGKEVGCNDGQISEIGILIRDLLTGKIFIKDFPITISSKLGIDDLKAGEIANKIISQSFGPIIEDVKRIQRSKFPDKISQIQKESQPAGITQPTARPIPPRPEPATNTQQVRPVGLSSSVKTEVGPRNEDRPPIQPAPTPKIEISPQSAPPQSQFPPFRSVESIRPPQQMPPRLEVPPQRPEAGLQKQPEVQLQRPDLPQTDAQKSLEQELEKVAGVIDLRNNKKE